MSTALAFQSTTFDVIDRNGQPWIQSRQLAAALGYKGEMSVTKIYERNADEFTDSMTAKVNLTLGMTPVDVRIFSLRGCHLIAMFARTQIAKAFRVWVLDVLETLNKAKGAPALDTECRLSKRGDPERKELHALVNTWVGCAPLHYAAVNAIINAHIGVSGVDEMTLAQVRQAIEFARGKIAEATATKQAPLSLPPAPHLSARDIAIRAEFLRCYDEYRQNWDEAAPLRSAIARAANRVSREHGDMLASNAVYALQELLYIQDMIGNGVYHAMSVARAVVG